MKNIMKLGLIFSLMLVVLSTFGSAFSTVEPNAGPQNIGPQFASAANPSFDIGPKYGTKGYIPSIGKTPSGNVAIEGIIQFPEPIKLGYSGIVYVVLKNNMNTEVSIKDVNLKIPSLRVDLHTDYATSCVSSRYGLTYTPKTVCEFKFNTRCATPGNLPTEVKVEYKYKSGSAWITGTSNLKTSIKTAYSDKCPAPSQNQNHAPVASFTFSPASPKVNEAVTFDASASTDADNDPLTYSWDFDGNGVQDAAGVITTHQFASVSDNVVILTVSDGKSPITATQVVHVISSDPERDLYNQLNDKYDEYDNQYDDLKDDYDNAVEDEDDDEIDDIKDELKDLKSNLNDLDDEIDDALDSVTDNDVEDDLEDLQDDVKSLLTKVKNLISGDTTADEFDTTTEDTYDEVEGEQRTNEDYLPPGYKAPEQGKDEVSVLSNMPPAASDSETGKDNASEDSVSADDSTMYIALLGVGFVVLLLAAVLLTALVMKSKKSREE